MKIRATHTLIAAASGLGLTLSAHAADATWQFSSADDADRALVFAQDVGGPSLSLVCSDKLGVQAVLYLNGADAGEATISSNSRVRSRSVGMSTDTVAEKKDSWGYLRTQKLLVSTKSWQGKRIFNAAIKGENVNLGISRLGDYTLTLPPIDENFTAFATSCNATNPSK